jgi:hypothetical protein
MYSATIADGLRLPMLWLKLAAAFLCSVTMLAAQDLPAGTALPVMLNSTLDAKKDKPGEKIDGKTMQEVPLPSGAKIKSGSHVLGHVVSVVKPAGGGSRIVVTFDQLENEGTLIPLSVSLRALASTESVFNAKLPMGNQSDYESSNSWTTKQVGGDVVNRGRGVVASATGVVGKYSGSGVWGKLTRSLDGACPARDGEDREQALWVFSASACGVYGFSDVKLTRNGSSTPVGQIELQSDKDVLVRGGSGWLLLVNASATAQ